MQNVNISLHLCSVVTLNLSRKEGREVSCHHCCALTLIMTETKHFTTSLTRTLDGRARFNVPENVPNKVTRGLPGVILDLLLRVILRVLLRLRIA